MKWKLKKEEKTENILLKNATFPIIIKEKTSLEICINTNLHQQVHECVNAQN